jgi:hypothetical protein
MFLSSGRHQVMEQHQPEGERLVATVLRRHFILDTNIANRQRSRARHSQKGRVLLVICLIRIDGLVVIERKEKKRKPGAGKAFCSQK